tara:strand:+ start:408 stop:1070 length:663 start_codon:yes stop_codon:yes gene_type:complete
MILSLLQNDIQLGVILIITLVFSLSFHEFAHAYAAYKLGDNTAAYQGRLTLNPLAHLDPIGSLMLLFIGFGYAKPVPVNPVNLQNPRSDMMKVAFAGPLSNLFLCLVSCLLIRLMGSNIFVMYADYSVQLSSIGLVLYMFAIINMTLAIFNLIPIHPLDGGQIFGGYLDKVNPQFSYKLRADGPKILFAIIIIGYVTGFSIIGLIISPFHELVTLIAGLK